MTKPLLRRNPHIPRSSTRSNRKGVRGFHEDSSSRQLDCTKIAGESVYHRRSHLSLKHVGSAPQGCPYRRLADGFDAAASCTHCANPADQYVVHTDPGLPGCLKLPPTSCPSIGLGVSIGRTCW